MDTSTAPQTLFTSKVPVQVHAFDREQRTEDLCVEVQTYLKTSSASSRVLHFRVTSDEDPLFLFTLDLCEEDFSRLREEQELLCDFSVFPSKVISLCKQVLSTVNDAQPFIAVLNADATGGLASFRFVQTNPFKHLVQLELKICPGSDITLKKYLAQRLNEFKATNEKLSSDLATTTADLTAQLTTANSELANYRVQEKESEVAHSNAIEQVRLAHAKEMTELRESFLKQQQSLQDSLREEFSVEMQRRDDTVSDLTSKYEQVSSAYKEATSKNFALETSERELQHKIESYEKDLKHFENEVLRLRNDNQSLDTTKFEQDKAVNGHLIRISALEQEVKDKDQMLAKMNSVVENSEREKRANEESITLYTQTINKLEAKVAATVEEIHKGNSIIQKLQSDTKAYKSKIKLKNTVLTQQEARINEYEAEIDTAYGKVREAEREVSHKDREITTLKDQLETTTSKLTELGDTLKSNDQVIKYLNSQLNDAQLSGTRAPNTAVKSAISNYNFRPSFYATSRTLDESATGRAMSTIHPMQTPGPAHTSVHPGVAATLEFTHAPATAGVHSTPSTATTFLAPPPSTNKAHHVQYKPFGSVRENQVNITNNKDTDATPKPVVKADSLEAKYLSASPRAPTAAAVTAAVTMEENHPAVVV